MDRRDFLRLAAGAATVAVVPGCDSGDKPKPKAESARHPRPTLRIVQWSHFVPAYDTWFDHEYTKRWGDEHEVDVVVDHIPFGQLLARADTEVAAQRGHDITGFVSPPSRFEDDVIDHREIVTEVEAKLGKLTPLVERSTLNPRTRRYFGFSDFWAADPANFRADLWDQTSPGLIPDTWDDVRRAGPGLKAIGHPLGLSMSTESDANLFLLALMHSFGASIQDEEGNLVINRPATIEAVRAGVAIYRAGMTDDVFAWDPASNNRYLASGTGSMILNAVSAVRAIEGQNPELAAKIRLAPAPAGPAARLALPHLIGIYVVWRFSKNHDVAQRFLIDLALAGREAFLRSGFYNIPPFSGMVPEMEAVVGIDAAQPAGKYSFIPKAASWSTNLGHPGGANAALDEVFETFLVPRMFAAAARGAKTPEQSVADADAEARPIFDKWRERGKI
jgi:multiple sugar transport system substrate-binding protein